MIALLFLLIYPRRGYRDLPVRTYVRMYVRSFICVPTVSLLYRLHFLTDCHETSHTCSQASSLVRVRKRASQVTYNPPNRGLMPPEMVSPLYSLHFLTDCHGTSHTCSQTSSLVRVRKWASQDTCSPLIGGFCPTENSNTSDFDEI